MNKLKTTLGAGASSIAMALSFAMPVAAQQVADCTGGRNADNECTNVSIDNSRTRTTTLGNCSAIINSTVVQNQTTTATNNQANVGAGVGAGEGGNGDAEADSNGRNSGDSTAVGAGGDGTGVGVNEQTNTSTTTATGTQAGGVNFAPDCSTHNVTNVTQQHVTQHHAAPAKPVAHTAVSAQMHGGSGGGHGGSGAVLSAASQVQAPAGGVGAGAGGASGSALQSFIGLLGSMSVAGLGLFTRKWNA